MHLGHHEGRGDEFQGIFRDSREGEGGAFHHGGGGLVEGGGRTSLGENWGALRGHLKFFHRKAKRQEESHRTGL